MFNDISVASTAISSFNNAALLYPYFFVVSILALPLLFCAYKYGKDFIKKMGWSSDTEPKIGFYSIACLIIWLLLFGGNYAVIRDGISILSIFNAIILFISMILFTNQFIKQGYITKINCSNKYKWIFFALLLLLGVFSAEPTWYGILMQLSAIVCGIIVGSRLKKSISTIPMSSLVFGTITTLILMQPEFFRFGQLGNLTLVHLCALLCAGFLAITVFATRYTKKTLNIRHSAYIKLKWLFRIVSILALILFVLTESVPVFLGLLFVMYISEKLTLYQKNSVNLSKESWALLLILFGTIIMCPIISILGVIYLANNNESIKIRKFLDLL